MQTAVVYCLDCLAVACLAVRLDLPVLFLSCFPLFPKTYFFPSGHYTR